MKFSAKHSIEPLEARIAPARTIIAGVPNGFPTIGNDVDYTDMYAPKRIDENTVVNDPIQAALDDAIFLDTEAQILVGDTKIAAKVGGGVANLADTFYLRMSAGDVLKVFNTQSSTTDPYLTVQSGNIIAFFVDKDLDNEVDDNELTGIALGKNTKIILKSGVTGDVVTNLNEFGTSNTADDELDMTGLISERQGIGSLQVQGGAIDGGIISGGNIANVTVFGTVGTILAGSAANGKTFDFYPNVPGGDGTLSVTPGIGKAGPSISNVFVDGLGTPGVIGTTLNGSLNGVLKAGSGGEGGKGGTVTFVRITEDADGLSIFGGAGGDAGSVKTIGGAGGGVSRIYIGGFADPFSTVDNVLIQGGAGGNSAVNKGGAGGALKDIYVGYQFFGTKPLPTDELLIDRVQVLGGAGGTGKIGGAGGAITTADIRVETPEGAGDEIVVKGGAGGANLVAGGKAGAGGSLLNIFVRNQDLGVGAAYSDTLLQGGDGGSTVVGSSGAAGGSVTNVTLLSWEMAIVGGNGSDGKVGGNGGSISKVQITESDEILTIGARFDAGFGGGATAGNGGKGGDINGVLFTNSDLRDLIFNSGSTAANGGTAIGGKGGAGGAVLNIDVRDGNVSNGATQTPLLQPASVRTGSGGDGTKGGGAGGLMKNLGIDSTNMSVVLSTGAGGDAAGAGAKGNGGAGGNFDVVSVTTRDLVGGLPAFVNATAGAGGAGAVSGAGGVGGDVKFTMLSSNGSGFIRAGAGGAAQDTAGSVKGGAAGRGGSIIATQLTAENGDGELSAGNAGATGGKAGLGGSVTGKNADTRAGLFAHNNLLIQAGNGSRGGAGGSIKYVGYGSGTVTLTPTPTGNIVIKAGDGSGEGKVAGVGGSIFDLGGSLPSGDGTTSITAGAGGSTALKGAAGGSISDVSILSGGFAGAILTVQAGDAGDSPSAATGAKGGDVKNVTVSSVDLGTIFRSVVAGDGGDALKKGGAGGNIDSIFVDGIDIGDRRDVPFGLTQMGGIFAGKTGSSLSKVGAAQREGINGKVTNIVAKGIASIVAGHDIIPEAVELVDKVTLSGDNMLVASENVFTGHGAFRLSYKASVAAAETTQGDAATQEVQTITLGVLQAGGSTTVVYTFGDSSVPTNSTPALAGDATAAQVETALNALTSIQAAGGVTVTAGAGGFVITFNSTGDKDGVVSAVASSETAVLGSTSTAAQVKTALDALPTIQYLGKDDPNTPANEEHTGGTVTVTGDDGSFYVTFGQSGNVIPLEGIEVFNASVAASTEGSITDDLAIEQVPGSSPIPVTELQSGGESLFVEEFFKGTPSDREIQDFSVGNYLAVPGAQVQFAFSNSFPFVEATPGDAATREVQTIDLTAVKADPRSTFNVSFNGATSATLPSTATQAQIQAAISAMTPVGAIGGVAVTLGANNVLTITFNQFGVRPEFTGSVSSTSALLPVDSTDAQFETALNAMAPVRFTALDRKTGAVDVAPIPATTDAFFVNFIEFGDQPLLIVNAFAQERQEIESDPLDTDPLADFTLSFSRTYAGVEAVKGTGNVRERQDIAMGGALGAAAGNTTFTITYENAATNTTRTSAVLPANATNAQIAAAINAMGIGLVTLPAGSPVNGLIQITFNANGDNAGVFSAMATSRTAPLDATATETDVQNALNGLATIKGPGAIAETVTVVRQNVPPDVIDNDFEVIFQTSGSRDLIVAAVVTQEEQHVDASSILAEPTGSFRLGFGGDFTAEFDAATVTASEVQTALNGLASVQFAGGVVVTQVDTAIFDIRFNTPGSQNEFDIRYEVDEVQEVDFAPGKDFTVSVVKDVVADEVVPGAPGLNEVQALTLGAIVGSTAEFTISYDDGVNPAETTAVLTGQSTAAEIQSALEQLTAIGVGGVTVDVTGGVVEVTFQIAGDQPGLLSAHATQSTVVAAGSTAQQIEDAMNLLATVKASGDGATGGTVDVSLGGGSNMTVRFSSGGDQELVVVTQEQPLNVFTIREGGQVLTEIQAFSPKPTGQPTDAAYAIANLIGFYADHSELDANIFHFIKAGVGPTSSLTHVFEPGDQPIDGILFAKKANQGSLNVVPEAYRIGDVFYDWNNII